MKTTSKFLILVAMAILLGMLTSCGSMIGVGSFDISSRGDDGFSVSVGCFGASGYLVQQWEGETFYKGEQVCSLDDYLYSERIKISICDIDPLDSFTTEYKPWEAYDCEISSHSIKFMWCYSDHGIDIYISSDVPLEVKDYRTMTDVPLFGNLKIKISFAE